MENQPTLVFFEGGAVKGTGSYSGQEGGGKSHERGIQGAGGESRAAGANCGQQVRIAGSGGKLCKKGILPCSVIIILC